MSQQLKSYKGVCLKIGIFTATSFLLREIATFIISSNKALSEFSVQLLLSLLFLQIIPAVVAALMFGFKGKTFTNAYKVPERNLKAIANFPAIYGLGMSVNLITILVTLLFTGNNAQSLENPLLETIPEGFTLQNAILMFIQVVVLAPIFEEFIFRGALLSALKPYGNGVAVFTTAILFGAMHGNFSQFFYAVAVGIPLAYIAIATSSLFPTTCLHMMINSVSGAIILFFSNDTVSKALRGGYTPTDSETPVLLLFGAFITVVFVTAIVGLVLMIRKLIRIKKYRLALVWDEISNKKKALYLILTPGAIISVLLSVDVFGGFYTIARLLLRLVGAR